MFKVNWKLATCGDGYWSDKKKTVTVKSLRLGYTNDEFTYGELRVYFDTATWNVRYDGLIYTDSQFLRELAIKLAVAGFESGDMDYSEQGMQGDNYVSLDVGKEFLASWNKNLPVLDSWIEEV